MCILSLWVIKTRGNTNETPVWPLLISRHVFFHSFLFTSLMDLTWENQSQFPCLSLNQERQEIHCLSWDFILPFARFNLSCWASWLQRLPFVLYLKSISLSVCLSLTLYLMSEKKKRRVSIGSSFLSPDLTSDVISSGRDKRKVSEASAKRAF